MVKKVEGQCPLPSCSYSSDLSTVLTLGTYTTLVTPNIISPKINGKLTCDGVIKSSRSLSFSAPLNDAICSNLIYSSPIRVFINSQPATRVFKFLFNTAE